MYASVSELLAKHPVESKVLFVPQYQFGLAIEDALARKQGGWAALTCTTPGQFAQQITRYRLSGEVLPQGADGLLVARAIGELPQVEREALLLPGQPAAQAGTAQSLARLFGALRREDITPDAYRQATEGMEGAQAERHAAEASAFATYTQLLDTHSYIDGARTIKEAIRAIEEEVWTVSTEVFAVLGELPLTRLETRLLEAIQARAKAFYLIPAAPTAEPDVDGGAAGEGRHVGGAQEGRGKPAGESKSGKDRPALAAEESVTYPEGTAGCTISAPVLSAHGEADGSRTVRCQAAVGTGAEVHTVFRDVIQRGLSFDDVEIAYTSAEPYLALIDGLAEKWEIPITLSVGRPIAETRPGQSLLRWLEWVQEGLEAPLLIRLLRSGLLCLDRVQEASKQEDPRLSAPRAASLLASIRYERGPDGRMMYRAAIDRQIDRLKHKRRLFQESDEAKWRAQAVERELADWRQLRRVTSELLALVPEGVVSAGELAGRCRSFVIRFGPIDAPPKETSKEDRTIDESARNRLVEQLSILDEAALPYEAPAGRLGGFLARLIERDKVRAARPLPGQIHAAPLESAGYGARPHLYVVGLDATSTGRLVQDADLTLADDERERLSEATGAALVDLGGSPHLTAWKVEQVRARRAGDMTLFARTFDVREGEERHPSPLYLRWGGKKASDALDRPIGFATFSGEGLPLDDSGGWLQAYAKMTRKAPSSAPGSEEEAEKSAEFNFAALYPGAARGLTAERERASDAYTLFDGLLPDGEYPELDVLDGERVVSASRLERFANTPYLYFLRHVLNISTLDEPALEETGWLDPLRRGTILHDTFERFVRQLGGRAPAAGDEAALREVLKARFQEETDRIPAPSRFVEDMTLRELWADALVFLRAETEGGHDGTPHALEYGFGLPPERRSGDAARDPALITFENGKALRLRGQIDRVDCHPDGTFSIWDYKTGRSSSFEGGDLLQDGQVLQWALYSYAFEALEKAEVREAGYFFTSAREMGRRITSGGKPARYRSAVAEALARLSHTARTGTFPPNLDHSSWRYSGFERCFPGLRERKKTIRRKAWPDDRPEPMHL